MYPFYSVQRNLWSTIFLLLFSTWSWSQIPSNQRYSMEFTDQTMEEMFQYIENTTHWSIYYEKASLPNRSFSKNYTHANIPEIISDLLAFSDLAHLNYRDYAIVVLPKITVESDQSALHYQRYYDSRRNTKNKNILSIGQFEKLGSDGYADLRIKIVEQDQRVVRGANVSVYNNTETDQSDKKGIARISLLAGQHILKIEHPLYLTVEQVIDIYSSGVIKIFLSK